MSRSPRRPRRGAGGPPPVEPVPDEPACALCGRPVPPAQADAHHLVPRSRGGTETVVLHRICHRLLHARFTENELASRFATVEALKAHPDVARFVAWVRTKPADFYERTRRSADKGRRGA